MCGPRTNSAHPGEVAFTTYDGSMSPLTRREAQNAAQPFEWRYLLGTLEAIYPVSSITEASALAAIATKVAGRLSERRLQVDLRGDRVRVAISDQGMIGEPEVDLMRTVAGAIDKRGWHPAPATSREFSRPVMALEWCIDTENPDAIRDFWREALSYSVASDGSLFDPAGQGPSVWFQEMNPVRKDRNRVHVDISVAHDEAPHRIARVLAAGGTLGPTSREPAFSVLIDREGNEVCVCTWSGRDEFAG